MTPLLATIDPWILTFSAATVLVTIWMGFWSARRSKTASDFYVAGRSVSVGWNASAISGEYLSAASFMGVAGMVMAMGYDALWYPVCYACGYLFLLLFIAGPLRRFGAYTVPDLAEGRFDSPLFRKIAVVFVLFIGFFYTMPQMKGAGTTLAYIFPGLPYWAGVVLVGAVITLNVALGGMKGITLVQAFQYWAKMFAISVPIFVLMAVYGHYGKQLSVNSVKHTATDTKWENLFTKRMREAAALSPHQQKLKSNLPAAVLKATDAATSMGLMGEYHLGTNILTMQLDRILDLFRHPDYPLTIYQARHWPTNATSLDTISVLGPGTVSQPRLREHLLKCLATNGISLEFVASDCVKVFPVARTEEFAGVRIPEEVFVDRKPLPEKAPADSTWLSPFGPLTTKAAKVAAAAIKPGATPLAGTNINPRFRLYLPPYDLSSYKISDVVRTNQTQFLRNAGLIHSIKSLLGLVSKTNLLPPGQTDMSVDIALLHIATTKDWEILLIEEWDDDRVTPPIAFGYSGRVVRALMKELKSQGIELRYLGGNRYLPIRQDRSSEYAPVIDLLKAMAKENVTPEAWLAQHERPLALLYTYSLIIALVCGTAGLPHILVRFYTNPDGVAAKRTTMWVMILIGVFYVFPPVFGVMGRNLFPELYSGIGAKGTDKIVLELPRLLNEKYAPLGSILSGITCAGAFAAFMSTFSGLLVSMTGAMAHDVYGRMLNPKATNAQRMRAFKIAAVGVGAVAILLGTLVEPLQINFMVGQAFAIAAASYFPLLFMCAWWRNLTMKGAATGMLTGGLLAVLAISLTSFSDLALATDKTAPFFEVFKPLNDFWAQNPLLRILCEQPAIWAVPLALTLMIIVSKLTRKEVPADIRMKMLVLHAPEKLGLKQEYIQEHQPGGH